MQIKHRPTQRTRLPRAFLLNFFLAALLSFVLGLTGCKPATPKPTPTRTPGIVIITASPLPETATPQTPTVTSLPPITAQPTLALPTPIQQETFEPYPPPLPPTPTSAAYPSP